MIRYVRLSYPMAAGMPLYPGTPTVIVAPQRRIACGDSCNTSVVTFSSHAGTHLDAPRHFFEAGRTLDDYPSEALRFVCPLVVDCPKEAGEIIEIDDLAPLQDHPETDFLLLRTSFQRYRESDPQLYCHQNPCFAPSAATWLRKNFPRLRAVGIDCISIASPVHRDLGREAHRILLAEDNCEGSPVLIVEDITLPEEVAALDEVLVLPLLMGELDGSPCTVLGIAYD